MSRPNRMRAEIDALIADERQHIARHEASIEAFEAVRAKLSATPREAPKPTRTRRKKGLPAEPQI